MGNSTPISDAHCFLNLIKAAESFSFLWNNWQEEKQSLIKPPIILKIILSKHLKIRFVVKIVNIFLQIFTESKNLVLELIG